MPLFSPTYQLAMFLPGEGFSVSADRARMEIIDNQLGFLHDIVGDGRITGWAVTDTSSGGIPSINISAGMGIIDRFVVRSFGSFDITLLDNRELYLYMRRKQNIIGGFSGFSDMANYVHVDSADVDPYTGLSDPAPPIGFSVTSSSRNSISLTWDANSEPDFNRYIVQRSPDGLTYTKIKQTTLTSYVDINLTQDTTYYYRLIAVDLSDNESDPSPLTTSTQQDLRTPLNASLIKGFGGDGIIQILYSDSPLGEVDHYEAIIQEVDGEFQVLGSSFIVTASVDDSLLIIEDNIDNGSVYKVQFYAVSVNGITSDQATFFVFPAADFGPTEVSDIDVSFAAGGNTDGNIAVTVSWTPGGSEYETHPDAYVLKFFTNDGRESNTITVSSSTSRTVMVLNFTSASGTKFELITPRTDYIVRVQAKNTDGDISNGIFRFFETPTFKPLSMPRNLSVTKETDLVIMVSWDNSTSIFTHNVLTITRQYLVDSSTTILLNGLNIGAVRSYSLDSSVFLENSIYTFQLVAVDEFGNVSPTATGSYTTTATNLTDRPPVPDNQFVVYGDKLASLTWKEPDTEDFEVAYYRIWRASTIVPVLASQFSLIETVPADQLQYVDYTVENGTGYSYFVTTVDVLGRESENPINDGYFRYPLLTAHPTANAQFSNTENVIVSQQSQTPGDPGFYNAIIAWDLSTGIFDGYEIWRSDNNTYEFIVVGHASPSDTSYVDEEALLIDGYTYYYLVRKFRNEVDPIILESATSPQGSILISKIITSSGLSTIDETVATELENMEDPIRAATQIQIKSHKHNYPENGTDKRVSFNDNFILDEWTTTDYQTYTTEQSVSGSTTYIVKVNGKITDLLYSFNLSTGVLSFERKFYSTFSFVSGEFDSAPTITVELQGASETQGELPNFRVGSLSSSQFSSGRLRVAQIPTYDHEGRLNEKLIPTQENTETSDYTIYSLADVSETLGDGTTFYDLIGVVGESDGLLAATSRGVLKSDDFGTSWNAVFEPNYPTTKLFYSATAGKYFVLTPGGVFASDGDLSDWARTNGLNNDKIIRDIIEDNSGNIYVSTDLGVSTIAADTIATSLIWEQSALFSASSTEAYALLYDGTRDRVIASNELGVLSSTNQGAIWVFTGEFDEFIKFYSLIESGGYIFGIANKSVWRRGPSDSVFERIAEIPSEKSRRAVIYEERLLISTEDGLISSSAGVDIFTATDIELDLNFPQISRNGRALPVTAIAVVDGLLMIGTDKNLFISDKNYRPWTQYSETWSQYNETATVVPTIYVNSSVVIVGVYCASAGDLQSIFFDERNKPNSIVTVANQYAIFTVEKGGWSNLLYDAPVDLRVNATTIQSNIQGSIERSTISAISLPSVAERTSNFAIAKNKRASLVESISAIGSSESEDSITAAELRNLFSDIEGFLSELIPSARVVIIVDENGIETFASFVFPNVSANFTGGAIDVTEGIVTFASAYDKYDDLRIDIHKCLVDNIGENTHQQIDDAFENVNSGLPGGLSVVQQANILKFDIFNQRQWPLERMTISPLYQASTIIPGTRSWYDRLNSTIDYTEQILEEDINGSLAYASAVIYLSAYGRVLVGGDNGFLRISTDTLNIEYDQFDSDETDFTRAFVNFNNNLYALTNSRLYKSEDGGMIWEPEDRSGLPNDLFNIVTIGGNLIISGSGGLYLRSANDANWQQVLESTNNIEVIISPDLSFAFDGAKVYSSNSGLVWNEKSSFVQSFSIRSAVKFRSLIFLATSAGLYKDDGTLYSSNGRVGLIDVAGDVTQSAVLGFNDVIVSDTSVYAASSNGSYYQLLSNAWTLNTVSALDTIHKMLLVGDDLWLFGYDLLKVPDLEFPIKLTTGISV